MKTLFSELCKYESLYLSHLRTKTMNPDDLITISQTIKNFILFYMKNKKDIEKNSIKCPDCGKMAKIEHVDYDVGDYPRYPEDVNKGERIKYSIIKCTHCGFED